jgi:hypothetical protein
MLKLNALKILPNFQIKDLLRGTIEVETAKDMVDLVNELKANASVVEIKNALDNSGSAALPRVYIILNFKVKGKETGILAEIQIMPICKGADALKKKTNHLLYEISRSDTGPFGALCARRFRDYSWFD